MVRSVEHGPVAIVTPTMGAVMSSELELQAGRVREHLATALQRHGRLSYSNSLGAEAMVLTDIIWSHFPARSSAIRSA